MNPFDGRLAIARGTVVVVPVRIVLIHESEVAVRLEAERLLEKAPASVRVGVGAHAVESLQRELTRDLRIVCNQRLVIGLDDGDLEAEAFRVLEAKPRVGALRRNVFRCEPLLPEVECFVGGDTKDDPVHHSRAGTSTASVRILEERQVTPRAPLLVRVEKVIDGRVVLVDGFLDEPETEDANVEVDVPRRVGRDAGDVVDSLEVHGRLDCTAAVMIWAWR